MPSPVGRVRPPRDEPSGDQPGKKLRDGGAGHTGASRQVRHRDGLARNSPQDEELRARQGRLVRREEALHPTGDERGDAEEGAGGIGVRGGWQ